MSAARAWAIFVGTLVLVLAAGVAAAALFDRDAAVIVESVAPPDDASPYRDATLALLHEGETRLLRVQAAWDATSGHGFPRHIAANVTREEQAWFGAVAGDLLAIEAPPGYVVAHGEIQRGLADVGVALGRVVGCHEDPTAERCGDAAVALERAVERVRDGVARWP